MLVLRRLFCNWEESDMVEWKTIKELCCPLKKAIIKQGNLINDGCYPVINSGISLYGYFNEYNNDGNAFTFASRGEYAGFVTYIGEKFWAGGLCYPYRSKQEDLYLTKYIYQYLKSKEKNIMDTLVMRGGIPALNKVDVEKISIPIPSKSEQERIVSILDTFTSSISNLKEQIKERRKQYEYYRDQLLDLEGKDGVEMNILKNIVDFRNGKGHEKSINPEGSYIVVNSKFISTNGQFKKYCNTQISPLYKDDILMVMSDLPHGKALAKCFLVEMDDKYTLNQRICALKVKDESTVLTKYLFIILNRNKQLLAYDNGVDQTNLRKDDILNISAPIPTKQEQLRIVTILDQFEASIANLEAQLKEREKQYEYYRNQLLTFE